MIHLKNIICNHCKWDVQKEFHKLGFKDVIINLFEIVFSGDPTHQQLVGIHKSLQKFNIELACNAEEAFVEKVKYYIIEMIHTHLGNLNVKNSVYLEKKMNMDYNTISKRFSRKTPETIEHYIIMQRIEFDKESIRYENKTLTQIANEHNYKNLSYFSAKFKEIGRMTPSEYRKSVKGS